MQLANLINGALPQRADAIAGAMRAWSRGQTLDATVLRVGNGQALLQVNGQHVLAQTRMPLSVGQSLRLQVDKAGTQPQLRVLDGSGKASANAAGNGALLQILNPGAAQARSAANAGVAHSGVPVASGEALAAAALRKALPQRQSLPQSMSVLEHFVAAPRSTQSNPALEQARAMAADFLQGLPRAEDARDAKQLRAMVQRSGLFHEAELAQYSKELRQLHEDPARALARQHLLNPPAADMKARLLAVAGTLAAAMRGAAEVDQRNEQAAAALRGAVSNIEANQIASVRGSDPGNGHNNAHNNAQAATWRVDLPFVDARGHQALQLRIDREPRGRVDEAAAPSWIAQVTIQAPGQAPLHARIALNGDTVYTTFSTADEALARQIEHRETELRQLLDVVHLALGGMRCRQAAISDMSEVLPAAALVSEHA